MPSQILAAFLISFETEVCNETADVHFQLVRITIWYKRYPISQSSFQMKVLLLASIVISKAVTAPEQSKLVVPSVDKTKVPQIPAGKSKLPPAVAGGNASSDLGELDFGAPLTAEELKEFEELKKHVDVKELEKTLKDYLMLPEDFSFSDLDSTSVNKTSNNVASSAPVKKSAK